MNRILKLIILANIYFSPIIYAKEMRIIHKANHPQIIEDFEFYEQGKFPETWEVYFSRGKDLYAVMNEDNNSFLRASVKNESVNTALRVSWKIEDYPYLSWRWRINNFPEGADERKKETHDSAAGVYVLFKQKFRVMPRVIKYIWSLTIPKGTKEFYKKNRAFVVVRKGDADLGKWIQEEINLAEDFNYFYSGKKFTITGVSILSDSDATSSFACADYDDFTLSPIVGK